MVREPVLDERDLAQLREQGITREEALRHLRLLRQPPAAIELDRPCTVGDGILVLGEADITRLRCSYEAARRAGRLMTFVPASGAASRMFQSLLAVYQRDRDLTYELLAGWAAQGDRDAQEACMALQEVCRFAFFDELKALMAGRGVDAMALASRGLFREIVSYLLTERGLNYAALPKALLPFHQYDGASRTAIEEHLVEAAGYVKDEQGSCRLHVTVSPEHEGTILAYVARVVPEYERHGGCRFEVRVSVQQPSTGTVAIGDDGDICRLPGGRLLLRPGGHGALLENLQGSGGDLVFIKNIDNVAPDRLKGETIRWKQALAGLLVELQEESSRHLARLTGRPADPPAIADAVRFVTGRLGWTMPIAGARNSVGAQQAAVISALNRPLRVCGVVKQTGEPGGGPFWVKQADGSLSLQIVEGAQVNTTSAEQTRIFAAATHFNPVDLVCGLRDWKGAPFTLRDYVDQDAAVITRKSQDGRELVAMERPGLWNGAMAFWNTVFVEVPIATFNPVKTVTDLLRPTHQN